MKAWSGFDFADSRCCAAAYSSGRICPHLDTALLPVVSICVARIEILE